MSRTARHQAILDLVAARPFRSQEDLADALADAGFDVTQSTLSRDLGALGIAKTTHGYVLLKSPIDDEPLVPAATRTIATFMTGAEAVGQLVVVRTAPGGANVVAKAIDVLDLEAIAGSIAGDDTIFLAIRSAAHAKQLTSQLLDVAQLDPDTPERSSPTANPGKPPSRRTRNATASRGRRSRT